MAEKAKHAYGSRANLNTAMQEGKVDSFDVLFLNGENEVPAIGWISKEGEAIIIEQTDLSGVEAELATKANSEDVKTLEGQIATKADTSEIEALQTEIATKADVTVVQTMIDKAVVGAIEVVEF